MRLLIAAGEWFPDRASGYARVVSETTRRLAARGHDVIALVPSFEDAPPVVREGSLAICRQLHRGHLPVTLTDVLGTRQYVRSLKSSSVDVFVAHGPTNGFGLTLASVDRPLVFVYHASAVRELRFIRGRLPLGRERMIGLALDPPLALYERATVSRATDIVVLSDYSRRLLIQDHPRAISKIRRVSGGVDTAAFSPADREAARERLHIHPDLKLLVTVRRLERRMGIEQLLHALTRIPSSIQLTIVGEGPLAHELQRVAVELGVDTRVQFTGLVPDSELVDWYRAADLFVLPTVAYEGFGLVTAEALACGTPVVGTRVGATPELLEPLEPRLVASSPQPDALASAIVDALALAGPELRARCRRFAEERFAWETVVDGWERALLDASTLGCRRAS